MERTAKEPGVNYQVKSAIAVILTDRPIAYHPILAKVFGSINAALYLSQLLYWTPRADKEGWFFKTEADFTEETGLSRSEQETARKKLLADGVLEAVRKGLPARLFYRVNVENLTTRLQDFGNSLWASPQQLVGQPATFLTEITTEITERESPTLTLDSPLEGKTARARALPPIDEAFKEAMVDEFKDQLGGIARVREAIADAMNHVAIDKAKDKRLYLRGWLRRDAERIGGRNGATTRQGTYQDFDNSHEKFVRQSATDIPLRAAPR